MNTYFPAIFGENLFDVFNDFDYDFSRRFDNMDRTLYGKRAHNLMKTDVSETDDSYQLSIDLPGFAKEDIHAELKDGCLTISTEKTLDRSDTGENGRMLRRERYTGTMQRSFFVGNTITEEDIKANYENGVLKLLIPKKERPAVPERRTILIEG